jgi:hypothetical protein
MTDMNDKKKKLALYRKTNSKKPKSNPMRPIGSVVLSPDQQEKTMTMGKQPIRVYP